MAYNASGFQLTQLLQDAWYRLGQIKRWTATGGGLTSVINTTWAGVEEQIYEDDDPALIYGTAIVLETSDHLAPEGEMRMITDYDSGTQVLTTESFSAAVQAGDKVGIVSPLFPLEDMVELANIALQKLGEIDIPDTTLSFVANQTEYLLPTSITERPIGVFRQTVQSSANNQWQEVSGWDVIPQAVGTQWKLVLPVLPQNYSIMVLYRAAHPKLTAYDSTIHSSIHPELAVCALVTEALQWYNNQIGGSNQWFLQLQNKSIQDLEQAYFRHPIRHFVERISGMPHWGRLGDYVPGTSDLRA